VEIGNYGGQGLGNTICSSGSSNVMWKEGAISVRVRIRAKHNLLVVSMISRSKYHIHK
jgi:hypothetical protein